MEGRPGDVFDEQQAQAFPRGHLSPDRGRLNAPLGAWSEMKDRRAVGATSYVHKVHKVKVDRSHSPRRRNLSATARCPTAS